MLVSLNIGPDPSDRFRQFFCPFLLSGPPDIAVSYSPGIDFCGDRLLRRAGRIFLGRSRLSFLRMMM